MEKISINKLSNIYKNLVKTDSNSYNFHSKFDYYLYLSVHNSREDREFDINNYKLLKSLISINLLPRYHPSKIKLKISGFIKYLISLKEYQYLFSKKLSLIIIQDILKCNKQLIDIAGLAIITSISVIKNKFKKKVSKKLGLKSKKIYSIYYWMSKRGNSSSYYYPDIHNQNDNFIFISSFADSKFLSSSLLSAMKHTNFLYPGSILGFRGLLLSFLQTIHLYLYDLKLVFLSNKYSFLKFWVGWKKGSEIFYSILIYNSIIEIAKNSQNCEFISWYENQFTNRAFSLGASFAKIKLNAICNLSSYYGSIFTEEVLQQYLPKKNEQKIGFWGTKCYLQDYESLSEMKTYLNNNKISMDLEVVPKEMLRSNFKTLEKAQINHSREITIFTHSTYWDLIASLLSIFNQLNENNLITKKQLIECGEIFIRLHPSLDKEIALKEIKIIKEIPESINYKFIDNNSESIIHSMKRSQYCIFGLSAYVNLAIDLNCRVIAVKTTHVNNAPIRLNSRNSNNLKIINPW